MKIISLLIEKKMSGEKNLGSEIMREEYTHNTTKLKTVYMSNFPEHSGGKETLF